MNRRTACSLLTWGTIDRLLGDDAPWQDASRTGLAALELGRRAQAEQDLGRALGLARDAKAGDLIIAQCLDNLALVTELKDGKRSSLYRESLAIREKALGSNNPEVARSLAHLALTPTLTGDAATARSEAERMVDRALNIIDKQATNELTAEVLEDVGLFRHSVSGNADDTAERLKTSEALYKRALEIREIIPGTGEMDLARVLELNAVLLSQTDRSDQAKALMVRSGEIRKRHIQKLAPGK